MAMDSHMQDIQGMALGLCTVSPTHMSTILEEIARHSTNAQRRSIRKLAQRRQKVSTLTGDRTPGVVYRVIITR